MTRPLTVMLVAAEASGDALGAGLAKALKVLETPDQPLRFVGVGGARMAELGIQSPFDIAELSILGLFEGVKALPRVKARVRDTVAFARLERPDVVILIDSWGFTLRVARALRAVWPDLPLIKYVGPQVWASRPGRAKTLAQSVDLLLALHPFDPPWFEKEGLKTVFVGNPALEVDLSKADPDRFRAAMGWGEDQASVMILPGSRPSEIARMMPVFELAARRIKQARPDVQFLMPLAETVAGQVEGLVATWPMRVHLVRGEAAKHDAMKAATVALACSGTVSTELAIAGCPMVIGYRVGTMTYWLLKLILTLPFITMFNIAAGRAVAPEFVQSGCTPEALADAVLERLNNPSLRAEQIQGQTEALIKMGRGGPDPSELAARAVMDFMKDRKG